MVVLSLQKQNTQFKLADMATRIEAAQLLVYKAAMAKATQKVYSVEAAKAKMYSAARPLWQLQQK